MLDFKGARRRARKKSLNVIALGTICCTQRWLGNFRLARYPCCEKPISRRESGKVLGILEKCLVSLLPICLGRIEIWDCLASQRQESGQRYEKEQVLHRNPARGGNYSCCWERIEGEPVSCADNRGYSHLSRGGFRSGCVVHPVILDREPELTTKFQKTWITAQRIEPGFDG